MYLRIRPKSTVPICLDLGTDNPKNLADPFYLGLRRKRVTDEEMTEFMQEFMREMRSTFPQLLVQFEVRDYLHECSIHSRSCLPRTSPRNTLSHILICSVTNTPFLTMISKVRDASSCQGSLMPPKYHPLHLIAPSRITAFSFSELALRASAWAHNL